jgi:NADPH-dependent curcumin reductase CurA
MAQSNYTRIVLQERPITNIVPTTFRSEVLPLDLEPKDAQVLVKVNWLSLDPAMRGWLRDARSYIPPVQIGEVMRAIGLGTVVKTGSGSQFEKGDMVQATFGEFMISQFPPNLVLISSSQVGRNTLSWMTNTAAKSCGFWPYSFEVLI